MMIPIHEMINAMTNPTFKAKTMSRIQVYVF